MNKKGFTLIELMAAIVILAIISLIAVPIVEQTLLDIQDDSYNTQIKSIKASAKQWGAENMFQLPDTDGSYTDITLGLLKSEGFVKKEIFNPKTKEEFVDSLPIRVLNNDGDYIYLVDEEITEYADPSSPTISLNGDSLIYVNMDGTYSELSATALTSSGSPLAVSTVVTYNGSVTSLSTSVIRNYTVTYSATEGTTTVKTARTVIIRDVTAPVLTVNPLTVTLAKTVNSYNIMTGVSATDNSGLTPVIKATTDLTLGIPGTYKITYTAVDNYGNTAVRERTVTISY